MGDRTVLQASPHAETSSLREYWAVDPAEALRLLEATPEGLSTAEATKRIRKFGRNELERQRSLSRLRVLWAQVQSPLILLLVFAAAASAFTGELVDSLIVLIIVVASVGIGFTREFRAAVAAEALRACVHLSAEVLRDGSVASIPVEEVVPGDVVLLSAGSLVPADAVILDAVDCFISEAMLTGESFPVRKRPGILPPETPLAARTNCVFLGSNVRSGVARVLVFATGPSTQIGKISHRIVLRAPETEFERGIRRFGYLLTIAMLTLVLAVFAAHSLRGRPAIETLLFSIALAVGLSPELLPAILSVNLANGAAAMGRRGVLVRHLNAIENLGSMDILCTDKTGTITEGVVRVEGSYDAEGKPSAAILEIAAYNAALQTGLVNPLDEAILQSRSADLIQINKKLGEIPFDFVRKRLSVIIYDGKSRRLITKGAFRQILEICTRIPSGGGVGRRRRRATGAAIHRLEQPWHPRTRCRCEIRRGEAHLRS